LSSFLRVRATTLWFEERRLGWAHMVDVAQLLYLIVAEYAYARSLVVPVNQKRDRYAVAQMMVARVLSWWIAVRLRHRRHDSLPALACPGSRRMRRGFDVAQKAANRLL